VSETARPSAGPLPASDSEPGCAVVTGGSAGIGRAICETLLGEGFRVVSLDRAPAPFAHAALSAIEVDLGDRAATRRVAADVVARHAPTTLVHNAGAIRPAALADVDLADLDALVELHLGTAIQLVQAALPGMRARGFGRVVLISSRAALGAATRSAYSATKAGLIGLARTWALELAADGITVNVVAPGPIRTDMYHAVVAAGSEQDRRLAASIPVGRIGDGGDVARAVAFFASPLNGFVTGQTLYVCGGSSVSSLKL
jgi:NAD(P)-dependent dehydrogenase (short-subunit alcohol dehydrogenase family)